MKNRIELVSLDKGLLNLILSEPLKLEEVLGVEIPLNWPQEPELFSYFLEQLSADPSLQCWNGYLAVDRQRGSLIGDCGFMDKPDHFGNVEIGYSVVLEYRNRGYGTEMVKKLLYKGFKQQASAVVARTEESNAASIRVLEKSGFSPFLYKFDPSEGKMIFWKRSK